MTYVERLVSDLRRLAQQQPQRQTTIYCLSFGSGITDMRELYFAKEERAKEYRDRLPEGYYPYASINPIQVMD